MSNIVCNNMTLGEWMKASKADEETVIIDRIGTNVRLSD